MLRMECHAGGNICFESVRRAGQIQAGFEQKSYGYNCCLVGIDYEISYRAGWHYGAALFVSDGLSPKGLKRGFRYEEVSFHGPS